MNLKHSMLSISLTFPDTELATLDSAAPSEIKELLSVLECELVVLSKGENIFLRLFRDNPSPTELSSGRVCGILWYESIENLLRALFCSLDGISDVEAYLVATRFHVQFSSREQVVEI